MIIHTMSLIHVSSGRNTIIKRQVTMPRIGTSGTNGVLNARGISGCLFRSTHTPMHTNIKAKSVPMLVISPTTLAGTKAANRLTNNMNSIFDFAGVRNFG